MTYQVYIRKAHGEVFESKCDDIIFGKMVQLHKPETMSNVVDYYILKDEIHYMSVDVIVDESVKPGFTIHDQDDFESAAFVLEHLKALYLEDK